MWLADLLGSDDSQSTNTNGEEDPALPWAACSPGGDPPGWSAQIKGDKAGQRNALSGADPAARQDA